jgi:excisionase family DNA binding protein
MTSRGTEKLLLSVPEAAEMLGISRSHLYQLIQLGKLPVVRLGASVRIPRVWLERYIEDSVQAWVAARNGWAAKE